jgi:cytochrome b subunit of formate dehydrogenase
VNPRTRPALRGMTHGDVTRAWAEQHHPHWVAEMDGEDLSRERQQT